jgi:hypothetical protein
LLTGNSVLPIGLFYQSDGLSIGKIRCGESESPAFSGIYSIASSVIMSKVAATGNVPTTTTINQLESIVQKRLIIKWVDAKRLIVDALRNCEISNSNGSGIPMNRQDEIIEEAYEIFADLAATERDQMRLSSNNRTSRDDGDNAEGTTNEPEWKRKARIQAERREAEWQQQQNIQQNQDKIQTLLKEKQNIIPEHEIPLTTIKSIRVIDNDNNAASRTMEQSPKESVPIVRIRRTTCYCIIQ